MKLSEVKEAIAHEVKLIRDGEFQASALYGRPRDSKKNTIAFVLGEKYLEPLITEGVACIICPRGMGMVVSNTHMGGVIEAEDPKTLFFLIHNHMSQIQVGGNPTFIDPSAIIDSTSKVSPYNVEIGKNVTVGANVIIEKNVKIGAGTTILNGSVIGSSAFYHFGSGDNRQIVHSAGGLVIGQNVYIHNNVTIEKGVLGGNTQIGDNTAIDHSCVISHDTKIGKNCTIVSPCFISGWTSMGSETFVGGGATIAPAIKIGKKCKISMGAVVTKDVLDGGQVTGNFAIEHKAYITNLKKQLIPQK